MNCYEELDEGGGPHPGSFDKDARYEQKRTEELSHSVKQSAFDCLAVVAHELRNPLASIASAIEVLEQNGSPSAEVNAMYSIIKRQGRHMCRLIDGLLDHSRISHGKLQLRLQRLDLAALVRQICADCGRLAADRDIALEVDLPSRPLWLDGDPTRLAQVLINLLQNAVKFTAPAGAITVAVQRDADAAFAILAVRDNGIGMEQHQVASVFEPFMQAQHGVAHSGGLGLGLTLVKEIVQIHGGKVTAESAGLDRGSHFSVWLPLPKEPIDADRPVNARPTAHCYRILVIDDRRDSVLPLTTLLTRMGHNVQVAADGETGIAVAGQFRPQIVLCDIGLPGKVDGYGVAAALRGAIATRSALLVAITAYTEEQHRLRATEAGFDRHMAKPIGIGELESILASMSATHCESSQEDSHRTVRSSRHGVEAEAVA